jgi:hypothetical protein
MKRHQIRDRIVTVRLSEHDYERLVERSIRAGAKTPSAYIRAACLTGQEFQLPAWEALRDLRNAVINANNAHDHPSLIAALDRISRF